MTGVLTAQGIDKSFFGVKVLDQVNFDLQSNEIHALLGENGAGKSTLVKILTGAYRRDAGKMQLAGAEVEPRSVAEAQALGIGTVYQEVNLLDNLTVAENLYLGRQPRRFGLVDRAKMRRDARALLARYGIDADPDETLAHYPVAIRQIIAIARAVDLSGKVLFLDEPTASLDAAEVQALFAVLRQLRDQGLGIVIITHFLDQVYQIADRVTVLRNGKMVGNRAIADLPRRDLVAMMLGRELAEATAHRDPDAAPPDTPAEFRFQHYGKRGSIAPFDLDLRPGEVVGIAGLLGSGRTETARLLFGIDRADSGQALVDGQPVTLTSPEDAIRLGFGMCPEERKSDGIIGDLSVRQNIVLALQARRGWANPVPRREADALAARYIKALDIRPPDPNRPIKFLSGGNQQKAILARWLATDPRLLILDEPTRGIDIGAHAEIINLIAQLRSDGMALVVISSEIEELVSYSSRVIILSDRQHVRELRGAEITPQAIVAAMATPGAAA
ncbi:sugar ABC transporter ATP-binding protein [Paracoccus shanxieyensis]|uniref:ATP-binding cassette domain-containing protein n=1 Tax=Paracoccus shanxieyensis TaxID=2675752 RepID=A0A6L6J0U4_9RHOB|nr:sugar ABC transporter ATP-binding protein [Paracoccus shanxieyensis]MTH65521.1 ATP-binding cassette domain-containing protein [Paracoccus shanxieyensis]MTH88683.1 ATP-binding cassette domain-containing protein [Paracoccus shanxieyensis]